MICSPSHVAVLVPSVRKAADYCRQLDFEIGEEEAFPETREIYVQGSKRNALLLMEAKDTGSYRKALQKRGPGIHHLAIDALDLEGFLSSIAGSGWFFAPQQPANHEGISNCLSRKAWFSGFDRSAGKGGVNGRSPLRSSIPASRAW